MAAPKRATIPGSTFNSKASRVIGKLTDAPPAESLPHSSETAEDMENITGTSTGEATSSQANYYNQPSSKTVIRSNSNTVTQQNGNKADIKVTFYLTEAQVDKLDELVFAYKKRRGKRINRNDIIRHLIETVTIEDIEQAEIG